MGWQEQASCAPRNRPEGATPQAWTGMFFPGKGQVQLASHAKAVCQRCPVRADCLAAAVDFPELGVWGGLSERERRAQRLRAGKGPRRGPFGHGTEAGYRTHLRRGEPPCRVCLHAHAEAERRRRSERLHLEAAS